MDWQAVAKATLSLAVIVVMGSSPWLLDRIYAAWPVATMVTLKWVIVGGCVAFVVALWTWYYRMFKG